MSELFVPWAHVLTHIATDNPIPHLRTQLVRDRSPMFDGEIRNTQGSFEDIAFCKCIGRTISQATRTLPAMRTRNAFSLQFEIDKNLSQKEPRTGLFMQQHGVLAKPAEPTAIGPLAFK